jgi:hypothetical protein
MILGYLILSHLILPFLIFLFYLILSHLILSYLILSDPILSYLIWSDFIWFYLILSYLILSDLIWSYSYLILSDPILSYLILSYLNLVLILSYLISSNLILSYILILSYLVLPNLVLGADLIVAGDATTFQDTHAKVHRLFCSVLLVLFLIGLGEMTFSFHYLHCGCWFWRKRTFVLTKIFVCVFCCFGFLSRLVLSCLLFSFGLVLSFLLLLFSIQSAPLSPSRALSFTVWSCSNMGSTCSIAAKSRFVFSVLLFVSFSTKVKRL